MTEIISPIPSRLKNVAVGGHVAGADQIIDDELNMLQEEVNAVVNEQLISKSATSGTTGDNPYNGMGRKVLPKNMVSGVNTLTQAMMPTATGGNTVYVIQYDFTLGEDIEIPANCVLEFDGGSVSGNKITLNNTFIKSETASIGSRLDGNCSNTKLYVKWLINPTAQTIQDLLDLLSNGSTLEFEKKTYTLEKNIELPTINPVEHGDQPCLMIRSNNVGINGNGAILKSNVHAQGVLEIFDSKNVIVENIIIQGYGQFVPLDGTSGRGEKGGTDSGRYHTVGYWGYYKNNAHDTTTDIDNYGQPYPMFGGGYIGIAGCGIIVYRGSENITIKDIEVFGFNYAGIQIGFYGDVEAGTHVDCKNINVIHCNVHDIYSAGISVTGVDGYRIEGCTIYNIKHPDASITDDYQDPGYGITCIGTYLNNILCENKNGIITDNIVYNCIRKGIDLHSGKNIIVSNNNITDCIIGAIYAVSSSNMQICQNIQICNNFINRCGQITTSAGEGAIMVGGHEESASTIIDTNIDIIGNTIINSGTRDESIGIIYIYRGVNIKVNNNTILLDKNWGQNSNEVVPISGIVVGGNNYSSALYTKNIFIKNNAFSGTIEQIIRGFSAEHLVISDNIIKSERAEGTCLLYVNNATVTDSIITNNILDNVRGAFNDNVAISAGQITNVTCYNNILKNGICVPNTALDPLPQQPKTIKHYRGESVSVPIGAGITVLLCTMDAGSGDSAMIIVGNQSGVTIVGGNGYYSTTDSPEKCYISKGSNNTLVFKDNRTSGSTWTTFYTMSKVL